MELRAGDEADKNTVLVEFYGHTWILADHDLKEVGGVEIQEYRKIRKGAV